MSIAVYMEKITVNYGLDLIPQPVVTSRHDVTHCITKVGTLQDFISMDGDFVIPEFEFSLDNTDNETYWPNQTEVRNCLDYYNGYIKGGRVHVDVRYITASSNISIFYGALESTIPAVNYDTAEITFRATHIIKSALSDISINRIIKLDPYNGTRRGTIWEKYYTISDILPKSWGVNQTYDYSKLPDHLDTVNANGKKNYQLLCIHRNHLEQYSKQLDFLGDFLRAMIANVVWYDNKFTMYPITTLWTANATVALDDSLTEITKSEPWEDAATDVVIDAGETYLSYQDWLYQPDKRFVRLNNMSRYDENSGDPVTGWYSSSTSRSWTTSIRNSVSNSSGTRTIDAKMIDYLRIPIANYDKVSSQYRNDHKYLVLLADVIMPSLVLAANSFWCMHKVKLEVEAEGLNYYPGRQYSILGTEYKCVQTEKDLENETTKLTIVGA